MSNQPVTRNFGHLPRRSRVLFPAVLAVLAGGTECAAACGSSGDNSLPGTGADAQPTPLDASSTDAFTSDSAITNDATPPSDSEPSDAFSPVDGNIDAFVGRPALPIVPSGGTVITSPTLVTILASNDAFLATLPSFSDAIPSSQLWAQVSAEYGLGAIHSTTHLVGPSIAGTLTATQLSAYVSAVIAADAGPAPDGHTIYLVYLPDGALFASPLDGDCGYHESYPSLATSLGDEFAVVRRCAPYAGTETQLGALTRAATHEIIEAATDPLGRGYTLGETPTTSPWTASIWQSYASSGHVELADLCEGSRMFEADDGGPEGGWEYERIWSNAAVLDGSAGPCIPAPSAPYFSTAVANDWYAAVPGTTLSIPVGGWATGVTNDWLVKLQVVYAHGTGALGGVADGGGDIVTGVVTPQPQGCTPRAGMSDGAQGTIEIPIPSGVPSGDYAVVKMINFHEGATGCYSPLLEDDYDFSIFGVYVP